MRPIADKIEFGLSGAVAGLGHVVTNPFEARHEEVAFLKVERETVLDVDCANTFKEIEKKERVVGPHEAVVNDLATVHFGRARGKAETKEGVGFLTELGHDGSVHGGGIEWTKGHDFVSVFVPVGAEESKFLLIGSPNGDLVIAGFGVKADEVNTTAGTVTEIVKGVVATGNGKEEGESDGIERTEVDTVAPDKVVNAVNVFLVWFRSKEATAEPGAASDAFDVVVVNECLNMLLNDG